MKINEETRKRLEEADRLLAAYQAEEEEENFTPEVIMGAVSVFSIEETMDEDGVVTGYKTGTLSYVSTTYDERGNLF